MSSDRKVIPNPHSYSELYIHTPFCVKKCAYCDFLSFPLKSEETMEQYVRSLVRELEARSALINQPLGSVYFGGGTPSLLNPSQLERLMEVVRSNFKLEANAEITLEANPGTFDSEKAHAWRALGINRVSVGVQSFDDRLLKLLGRIHNSLQAENALQSLQAAGIDNYSLDLMFGLPEQSLEDFKKSLFKALELSPTHISLYSLIIEENTPFFELYGASEACDEGTEREMAHLAQQLMRENGIFQYEISNFARPGFESRHNSGYWRGVQYLGCGLGASSFIYTDSGALRLSNERNLARYSETQNMLDVANIEEVLFSEDLEKEFMLLGLRKTKGISCGEFFRRFGKYPENVFGKELKQHVDDGLLLHKGDYYALTEKGLDLANRVFLEFV